MADLTATIHRLSCDVAVLGESLRDLRSDVNRVGHEVAEVRQIIMRGRYSHAPLEQNETPAARGAGRGTPSLCRWCDHRAGNSTPAELGHQVTLGGVGRYRRYWAERIQPALDFRAFVAEQLPSLADQSENRLGLLNLELLQQKLNQAW